MSRSLSQWLALSAVLGGLAGSARADAPEVPAPPAPVDDHAARASKLYDEGRLHFDIGDYAAAITAWKESYLLSSASLLLFNIGQAYRLSNNCAEANRFYFNYKRVEANPKNQAELEQAMAKCEGVTPATSTPATSTTPTVTTEPVKPVEPTTSAVDKPGEATPMQPVPPRRVVEDRGSTLRTVGIASGTVGVLALLGGGLYGLKASSDASDISKKPIGTRAADVAALDSSGKSAATRGKAFGIVGLVLAAGGGTLWYLGHRADSHVEVSLAPGHTEVSFSCAF